MFSVGRRLISAAVRNHVRKYSADLEPVLMTHTVFQGTNTDAAKPPFLILHGLFGSKQNWRSVGKAMQVKSSRKIITLDARNHGDSPHTAGHGSMHITADVVHIMQQMGIKKAALMGHSMGGRAVMYMALAYPHLVEKIIVVDISPIALPKDFDGIEKVFAAMKNLQVPKELSMAQGRKYAEIQMKKNIDVKETVDFILLNLKKQPDGLFKWACNVDSLYKNLRAFRDFMSNIEGLQPYHGPVMFICGNKSGFVNPESEPQIKKIFPKCEIHWLDAGHLVHFDQPQKFINLLVQFLK